MRLVVDAYCSVTDSGVFKNGNTLHVNDSAPFKAFVKAVYKTQEMNYAKFFKMDELCKLAFIACEVLIHNRDISLDKTAIVLGNRNASYATDAKHQESINSRKAYFPSPAVFVYTLPNIMLGELCIRHNIKGENSCFLMEDFDVAFFNDYVRDLFEHESYKYCITGWVDYHPDKYEAHLFLIKDSENEDKQLFGENILQLIR